MCWIYAPIIAFFSVVFFAHLYLDRRPRSKEVDRRGPGLWDKTVALLRSFTYRRLPGKIGVFLGLPSAGVLFLIMIAAVASIAMTFTESPYYREKRGYGSPPIAVRTGLMSTSLIPLLIALSGKVNLITMITGYGHEKLNVFHRAIGWLMFILSVVHTIPFIYCQLHEFGYPGLKRQFYKPGAMEYTGVPPLAVGFFLSVFSIPWVRCLAYELFAYTHIAAAIAFLGTCFWHFGNEGDSWNYLWATMAIWLVNWLGRMFWKSSAFKITDPWFRGCPTTLRSLGGNMVRMDVLVPRNWTWRPGQHVFLRFPSIGIMENHPFTISSIPSMEATDRITEKPVSTRDDVNVLSFLVRPQLGFTKRLLKKVMSTPDMQASAVVDGPYGTVLRKLENAYEDVILVAGGGGISAILPRALHLANCMSVETLNRVTQRVRVVWMVKHADAVRWALDDLAHAAHVAPSGAVSVEIFVTEEAADDSGVTKSVPTIDQMPSKEIATAGTVTPRDSDSDHVVSHALVKHFEGRPYLPTLIPSMLGGSRTAIIGCGPESLKIDLSNASAAAQRKVLNGDVVEVMLHTETFDW
ncbi:hypothetical protein NA57DRAFT_33502 [Rhizodiscina lignyota]|uniref:ferric-chelate reductase (NADPH) n=1 Tax=Rhizodiscina lignyota TaxID=1504668 RepID=A0A9P4INS6_9PEZI|nr:hypothetical protein NA57DRAFT_33502 [Rhizodiscina lignyota]